MPNRDENGGLRLLPHDNMGRSFSSVLSTLTTGCYPDPGTTDSTESNSDGGLRKKMSP